jgi:hypothetical protein
MPNHPNGNSPNSVRVRNSDLKAKWPMTNAQEWNEIQMPEYTQHLNLGLSMPIII